MANSALKVVLDNTDKILAGVKALTGTRVLVGVPADKASRSGVMNNATLAYIHDNGAPEAHIPARPFMKPGIKSVQPKIIDGLKKAGELALDGGESAVLRQYTRIGTFTRDAIKAKIREGIPPPLAMGTLRGRAKRGRKGAQKALKLLKKGAKSFPSQLAIPLIDTAQMLNAISYVVKKK